MLVMVSDDSDGNARGFMDGDGNNSVMVMVIIV